MPLLLYIHFWHCIMELDFFVSKKIIPEGLGICTVGRYDLHMGISTDCHMD